MPRPQSRLSPTEQEALARWVAALDEADQRRKDLRAEFAAWVREVGPAAVATRVEWEASIEGFRSDVEALKAIVRDPARDVDAVLPDTPGHTLLREVRIVGDHNAYHIGEFAALRQVMGTWGASHR